MMLAANREALRFQHEYIGTEHVLLALTALKSGVAVQVLRRLDVDLHKVRGAVEAIMHVGPRAIPLGIRLTQTPRCKNAVHFAISEASGMNHSYVGTEHLLLGLLREDMGVAGQILMNEGLTLREVRNEVIEVLKTGIRFPQATARLKEIEDLPADLNAALADLNDELRRMTREKEQAVAACEFEKAAALRDSAVKLKRRKQTMICEWMARYTIDAGWLIWRDGAVAKLARRIHELCRWDLLPELGTALDEAGCGDVEMLMHCGVAGEHSHQCWVVDLLLAKIH